MDVEPPLSPLAPGRPSPARPRAVGQVGAVTDPARGHDREPVGHLVQRRRVAPAQLRELRPGALGIPTPVAGVAQPHPRLLELLALDANVPRALDAEEPDGVFDEVI